ncbi:MAG TPA: metallophosphoesterase [Nocardioidaceae bacterium]|nr:metallophosphoesterase [Nocardioidaceae bacterium]
MPSHPSADARRTRVLGAAVLLGLLGGWLGLTLGGTVHHEVGPLTTSMRVLPAWGGGTTVDFPPLGRLVLDTHDGPLGIEAGLDGVDVEEAREIVRDPELLQGMQERAEGDLRWELKMAVLRALLAAVLGALVLSALVLRRVRVALVGGATAAVAMGTCLAVALSTWNPSALAEPRYTGLLTSAPSVVGNAEDIVNEFSVYGDQLARIVQNVSGLYTVTSDLPVLPPQTDLVRVLHVSDLHLAPQSWDLIRTVVRQYDIDVVVDSGDITDHGSPPENRYLQEIRHLPVPYVWVRGNHDSLATQAAMRKIPNVVVLDGSVRTVQGLRFLGVGDPTFTPDKSGTEPEDHPVTTAADPETAEEAVARVADELAATAEQAGDVDVVVYHDPAPAEVFDGHASMVLSGHLHYRKVRHGDEGTWLMTEGSTGGSGLRALEPDEPAKIELSVLYVDRADAELEAYDDISLGGLGLASAQINRHVVDAPTEETELVAPEPAASPGATATPR